MGIIETIKMLAKEEAKAEVEVRVVRNFLIYSDFNIDKIAFLMGISKEFVQRVKTDFENNQ